LTTFIQYGEQQQDNNVQQQRRIFVIASNSYCGI